jgi:hypothetical protein
MCQPKVSIKGKHAEGDIGRIAAAAEANSNQIRGTLRLYSEFMGAARAINTVLSPQVGSSSI